MPTIKVIILHVVVAILSFTVGYSWAEELPPKPELNADALTPCVVSPPPEIETYIRSSVKQREVLLANYIKELMASITTCNDKVHAFREWYQAQFQLKEKAE